MLKVQVTSTDHIQGDEQAPFTLVEYGDYECPHCGFAYPIVKKVQQHFGKQLRFVFRNFPLNEIHPHAQAAAETAEFAATKGRFWEMHDAILENQQNIGLPIFLELAKEMGLSAADLRSALSAQIFSSRVREDVVGGVSSGVKGTPTFFINRCRHEGPYEFEDLVQAIEVQPAQKIRQ